MPWPCRRTAVCWPWHVVREALSSPRSIVMSSRCQKSTKSKPRKPASKNNRRVGRVFEAHRPERWASKTRPTLPTPTLRKSDMEIKVLVFDFGNVVGFFDHRRTSRRLAAHADLPADAIHAHLFDRSLEEDY